MIKKTTFQKYFRNINNSLKRDLKENLTFYFQTNERKQLSYIFLSLDQYLQIAINQVLIRSKSQRGRGRWRLCLIGI